MLAKCQSIVNSRNDQHQNQNCIGTDWNVFLTRADYLASKPEEQVTIVTNPPSLIYAYGCKSCIKSDMKP